MAMPMIEGCVEAFMKAKPELRKGFVEQPPETYDDIVKRAVEAVGPFACECTEMDAENVHVVDDGDCQGTPVCPAPEKGCRPSACRHVRVGYGPCSRRDALPGVQDGGGAPEDRADDRMTLAPHIVQGLREMERAWLRIGPRRRGPARP